MIYIYEKCPQLLNEKNQVAELYVCYMIPLVWNGCVFVHTQYTQTMFRETCLEGDIPEVLSVVIPGIGLGGSDKFHIFISYTFL